VLEPKLPPATIAAYVAIALQNLVDELIRKELPVPAQVRELTTLFRAWAQPGSAAADLPCIDSERPRLVAYGEVGRLLGGVSAKTVSRLVHSGQLRSVYVGDLPRVHVDDLDAYLDRLRGAPLDCAGHSRTFDRQTPGDGHARGSEDRTRSAR